MSHWDLQPWNIALIYQKAGQKEEDVYDEDDTPLINDIKIQNKNLNSMPKASIDRPSAKSMQDDEYT